MRASEYPQSEGGARRKTRCAIYTRKSTEEGLEQDFNSLHAQREACESYIRSQKHEGWRALSRCYDDGGISGATLQRPALQQLLIDIKRGTVDTVVVYKVDRLTRALSDFAKLVDIFDAHQVSFVSVTQAFNTTSSMGRLTLNVLLSFAQFEREVTAERIRDKIAASKQKGMWMGGVPPLGYDTGDKKLIVNMAETETVRHIYGRYLQLGSVHRLKETLERDGVRSKQWVTRSGNTIGGGILLRGALYALLRNPIYIGKVRHRGKMYDGQQDPVLAEELWTAVQQRLDTHRATRMSVSNGRSSNMLAGCVFDEKGDLLVPHHANKRGQRYRYYVSARLLARTVKKDLAAWRLPAQQLEQAIVKIIRNWLNDRVALDAGLLGPDAPIAQREMLLGTAEKFSKALDRPNEEFALLRNLIVRVELAPSSVRVMLDRDALFEVLNLPRAADAVADLVVIETPLLLRRRGVEAKLIIGDDPADAFDPDMKLITAIGQARRWNADLQTGKVTSVQELAVRENLDRSHVSGILPFAFLAPDIIAAIIEGRTGPNLTLTKLKRIKLPASWQAQRALFGVA